jgi:hypothetical protein
MTWRVVIEINNSRSPYIKAIIRLARRTANAVKVTGNHIKMTYQADKASDLEVMLNKVAGWKCTDVFLNNHLIRAREIWRALDCLLYWSPESAAAASVCRLCPVGGKCPKAIQDRADRIIKQKEADEARRRWSL